MDAEANVEEARFSSEQLMSLVGGLARGAFVVRPGALDGTKLRHDTTRHDATRRAAVLHIDPAADVVTNAR